MATYNLAASDLITLLNSTVSTQTGKLILETLLADSTTAGFPFGKTGVNTTNGPSDTPAAATFPVSGFDTVPSTGTDTSGTYNISLELITVPTSTSLTGSSYPAGVVGSETVNTPINITTSGGLVVAAGDQYTAVIDSNTGTAADTLVGGAYDERLVSSFGSNVLIGGSGANTLIGGSGSDTLIGGGTSRLVAGSGTNVLMTSTLTTGHDTLLGGTGASLLMVEGGNNRLVAGNGLNTLIGGSGHDTLISGGRTDIQLGSGNARVVESLSGAHDTITAGPGSDTVVMVYSNTGVANSIVGANGGLRVVDLSGANTLVGGSGADTLVLTGTSNGAAVSNISNQTITAGSGGVRIVTDESFANYSVSSAAGGAYTVNFTDTKQTLSIQDKSGSSVTIVFAGDPTGHAPVTI